MNAATSAGPWPTSSGSAIVSEKSGPIVAPSSTAQRKPPPGSSTTPSSDDEPERRAARHPGAPRPHAVGEPRDREARDDLRRVQHGEERAGLALAPAALDVHVGQPRSSARSRSRDMKKNAATSRQPSELRHGSASGRTTDAATWPRSTRVSTSQSDERAPIVTGREDEQRVAPAAERVLERHRRPRTTPSRRR